MAMNLSEQKMEGYDLNVECLSVNLTVSWLVIIYTDYHYDKTKNDCKESSGHVFEGFFLLGFFRQVRP